MSLSDPAIKSSAKNILRQFYATQAKKTLGQMRLSAMPEATKVADAVDGALNPKLSDDERAWVDRIEGLRREMSADTSAITVVDFGAGQAEEGRTNEEMYSGVISENTVAGVCRASKPQFWGLVLFKLVREFGPKTLVELGTCVGISAAYQASALRLNNEGHLITMEGAPELAAKSKDNLQSLGLSNAKVVQGRFQDNLDEIINDNRPIDYVFIDGHHDEQATNTYFEQFVPNLSPNAVVVFDDISWSQGMRNAWGAIIKSEHVGLSLDLGVIGICIVNQSQGCGPAFKIAEYGQH